MRSGHRRLPFSISIDKKATYPETFTTSHTELILPQDSKLRRVKYLNNVVEQEHRFIKKKLSVKHMICDPTLAFDLHWECVEIKNRVDHIRRARLLSTNLVLC